MLDLPAADAAAPAHWRLAPLPRAALLLARRDALLHADGHDPMPASPALLARLTTPAAEGEQLLACDSSAATWRLRHIAAAGAAQLWQAQSLADSRTQLYSNLRGAVARRLTEAVLHELRNPLNALSLHTDLMQRLLSGGQPVERVLPSLEVMRQRVGDLRKRQDAAVALWLGDAELDESQGAGLGGVIEDSLRLLRGHMALHEVRLRSAELELIGAARLRGGVAHTRLVLMALLLMASAGAGQYRAADGSGEVLLQAAVEGPSLVLELQAPLDGQALAREVADTDSAGLLAALALLLDSAGITLQADPAQALTRLTLPMS